MTKLYSLNFLKVLFFILIVFHHSIDFYNSYLCVEGFFMISGLLIYYTQKERRVIDAFKKRIFSIYPYYFVGLTLLIIFTYFFDKSKMYSNLFEAIVEYSILQSFFNTYSINYPMWFLSVLVFVSPIGLILIKKLSKKNLIIFSSIFIMIVYVLLCYLGGIEQWKNLFGFIPLSALRGFAALLMGVIIGILRESIKSGKWNNICEVLLLTAFIWLLFIKNTVVEFVLIAIIFLLVLTSSLENSLLTKIGNSKIVSFLNNQQLTAYINHALVISVFNAIFKDCQINKYLKVAIILIILYAFSYLLNKIIALSIEVIKKR